MYLFKILRYSWLLLGIFLLPNAYAQESGLEDAVTPTEPMQIVGFGDSLMAGYRLDSDESYTAQLEKALQEKNYNIIINNAGVSGDTSTGGLARIDWSVPEGTDLVLLELGANDMLRGISPELTRANLEKMIERLKQRNIAIVLMGMISAPNYGQEYANIFNPIYPNLAKKYNLPLYPFFLDGVAGHPKLQLDDGMHPTAEGVAVMVQKSLPLIEKVLTQMGVEKQL